MGEPIPPFSKASQDERYVRVAAAFGPALERLARACEADPDQRRDLLQEIHLALWRSFARYDGRCAEGTWVYRIAHNTAASHVRRARRGKLLTLDQLDTTGDPGQPDPELQTAERHAVARLTALIRALDAPDRQIVLLHLEGLEAKTIGEVCGLSPGAVATKLSRLRAVLVKRFNTGGLDDR